MEKYIIFFSSCGFLYLLRRYKLVPLLFVLLLWSIALGLKSQNYGVDIIYYFEVFLEPYKYQMDEPGLRFLNSFISYFSKDYLFFSLFYSFLLNFSLGYLFYKIDRKNAALYFLFFTTTFVFYQVNLNIYRQGLSVIFTICSLYFYKKNNIVSLMFFLFSIFLHKAAILGAILFIGHFHQIKKKEIMFVLAISIFPMGGFVDQIITIVTGLFSIFERTLMVYNDMANSGLIEQSSWNHRNIPLIFSMVMMLFIKNEELKENNVIFSAFIIPILVSSFFSSNVLLYDRIILFSQFLQPIVLFFVLKSNLKKYGMYLYLFIAILQLIFTVTLWGPRNDMGDIMFYPII